MQKISIKKEQMKLIMEVGKSARKESDDSRPILKYIKVYVTETKIMAVALDGIKMSRVEMFHGQTVEPFKFLIKPFVVPKDLISAEIEKEGETVNVVMNCRKFKTTYTFEQPNSDFPDYQKIEQQDKYDDDLQISFDAKKLDRRVKDFYENGKLQKHRNV
jgi:DNA polymerase III sliding clamp (beta) subunit (PCNA family)